MNYKTEREAVYETVMKAKAEGLIRLSAGNISMRTADGNVAITPSGIKYDVLTPADIAIVDLDGKPVDAPKKASSETPMHTALIKQFPHVGAVCHTHSMFAISFASVGMEIPVISLELFTCGAPIPVAPWACPGTAENAKVVIDAFKDRSELKVCMLRSHGLVAIGANLDQAFEMAYDAEVGMQIYYHALQLGKPEFIDEERANQIRIAYT